MVATATSWLDEFFTGAGGPTITNAATGTINNVATTTSGDTAAGAIRFTGVAPTVTGLASGAEKRTLTLMAVGGPLVLANESASSDASNRIVTGTGGNVTIAQGGAAVVVYDDTSARWRLASGAGGGGSFTAGGDLSGSSSSQTVEKVKGTTITTAGGALAVGAVLRTTAAGVADWGAVNLADTDAVTGTLPAARGGTGLTTSDLTGKARWAPTVNVGETGYELSEVVELPLPVADLDATAATNGQVITRVAGVPTWSALSLSTAAAVTGALPYTNGGTGLTALGSPLQVLRTNAGGTAIEWATISVSTPTGTGFRKIVSGVEQAAAATVDLKDANDITLTGADDAILTRSAAGVVSTTCGLTAAGGLVTNSNNAKLWTFDGVAHLAAQGDTLATLMTWGVPTSHSFSVRAIITCLPSGLADSVAEWEVKCMAKNVGGTVTIIHESATEVTATACLQVVDFDVSGTDLRLRVQPDEGLTLTIACHWTAQQLQY